MFIRNYADVDFVINYHNAQRVLDANFVTYVDDSWISLAMLKAMFGDYIEQVKYDTPIEEFMSNYKNLLELDKVYTLKNIGPGTPRIFIEEGKVDLYFSEDSNDEEDMILSSNYTNINGLIAIETLPKYLLIRRRSRVKPRVFIANVTLENINS